MVFDSSSGSRFAEAEYAQFRSFLERSCGIVLNESKNYLIDSRLRRILVDQNITSLEELTRKIEQPGHDLLRQTVIDAMTTNETLWFRDRHPFDYLKSQIIPELMSGSGAQPRIWCAACSSGQEPYSISICFEEFRKLKPGSFKEPKIIATDISRTILQAARQGIYEALTLNRGMSQERLSENFDKISNTQWQVKKHLRERIEFRSFNLKDSFSILGQFDVIFCRNVLIYFSSDLQNEILRKAHGILKSGGYLFLGGSETPRGLNDLFEVIYYSPGVVYRKK